MEVPHAIGLDQPGQVAQHVLRAVGAEAPAHVEMVAAEDAPEGTTAGRDHGDFPVAPLVLEREARGETPADHGEIALHVDQVISRQGQCIEIGNEGGRVTNVQSLARPQRYAGERCRRRPFLQTVEQGGKADFPLATDHEIDRLIRQEERGNRRGVRPADYGCAGRPCFPNGPRRPQGHLGEVGKGIGHTDHVGLFLSDTFKKRLSCRANVVPALRVASQMIEIHIQQSIVDNCLVSGRFQRGRQV